MKKNIVLIQWQDITPLHKTLIKAIFITSHISGFSDAIMKERISLADLCLSAVAVRMEIGNRQWEAAESFMAVNLIKDGEAVKWE